MPNMTHAEFLQLSQRCEEMKKKGIASGRIAPTGEAPPPTKPTSDSHSEAALHDQIIAFCRKAGYLYFHGAMGTRTSRTEGEPDFTICLPEGHTLFVECKTKTGKLSPAQQAVHHQAMTLGHRFYVVRCIGDFMQLITDTYDATQSLPKAYAPFAALRNPIGGAIPSLQSHLITKKPASASVEPFWNGQQYPTGAAVWAEHNRYKGLTASDVAIAKAFERCELKPIGDLPRPESEEYMRTHKRDFTEGQPE